MAKKKLLQELKFEHLDKVSGGVLGVAWDKEARKAILDCGDSPDLSASRKVTFTVEFKPRLTPSRMSGPAEYVGCEVSFSIGGVIPAKKLVMNTVANENGQLLFNPDAPEDPDQRTVQQAEAEADDDAA